MAAIWTAASDGWRRPGRPTITAGEAGKVVLSVTADGLSVASPVTPAAFNAAFAMGGVTPTSAELAFTSDLVDTSVVPAPGRAGNCLATVLEPNKVRADNGAGTGITEFPGFLPEQCTHAFLEYDLYMCGATTSEPFDFGYGQGTAPNTWADGTYAGGGKLPGLGGVLPGVSPANPTGGSGSPTTGWSGRLMWVGKASYGSVPLGTNRLIGYLYHPGQADIYGDNLWTTAALQSNVWQRIRVEYKLNDVGVDNGIFRLWLDGALIHSSTTVRYRIDPGVYITHLYYAVFRGGSSTQIWYGSRRSQVLVDNIKITTL